MAAYGAKLAARNAVAGNQYRYDNSSMPSVVFTDPQVDSAGLTETTARAHGLDLTVSLLPLAAAIARASCRVCVSKCRSRWSPSHSKHNTTKKLQTRDLSNTH